MLSQSDKHLNSDCCQRQQGDANNAAQSVQRKKSTTEEIMQGGHDMHSPETIFNAIEHLVANGHKEAALWVMSKLLADFPENARLHNEMAALAYEQADMPKALLHFKQAAALDPQNTLYLKSLADYYYVQEKDAENALTQYESVLNLDPNNVESLIMAGHVSLSLHRYAQGQQYYQRVLDLDPQNSEIRKIIEKMSRPALDSNTSAMSVDDLYAAAQTKIREGGRETAISLLEQLLARDDTHALAHNDLGVLQYESGNPQAALDHYEKAVGLQPENETLQKNLADFYLVALGDYERAMQTYVQVLKLNPQDVEALLCCSQLCMSLGKNDDARDFIHAALETEPWNENAQHLLRRLDQPIELPGLTGADLYERAKAKASEGDLRGAINDLGKYVTAEPDNANAHNDLGVLYFEAGDKDKTLAAYERAVQLEPSDHTYLKNLADFYLIEQSRTEEAMKLYLRVLEDNPQDIESLLASGMVSASLGQVDDATIFYNRVIEIEPWNEIAQIALNGLNQNGEGSHTEGASGAAAG
jgi:tetratricopeptide (TPR) repeat protein